ncbi:MAG TPA: helix-hairpin-helix domain-containing protein [Candidatus Angelobacter sp.]|jgi:DNA uptake protein ComE-like DNA-binding protein
MKAFLAGLGVGSAIGLWLAPASGEETRSKLKEFGTGVAERFGRSSGSMPQEQSSNTAQDKGPMPQMENASGEAEQGDTENQPESKQDEVAEVLNTASKTQLRSVKGIGDATARRIIENRPFESEQEVLENKVMPETVLKKLKDTLVDTDEGAA